MTEPFAEESKKKKKASKKVFKHVKLVVAFRTPSTNIATVTATTTTCCCCCFQPAPAGVPFRAPNTSMLELHW